MIVLLIIGLLAGSYFTGSVWFLGAAILTFFFASAAHLRRNREKILARAAARPPEREPRYQYTPSPLRTLLGLMAFGIPGAIVGRSWYRRRRVQ